MVTNKQTQTVSSSIRIEKVPKAHLEQNDPALELTSRFHLHSWKQKQYLQLTRIANNQLQSIATVMPKLIFKKYLNNISQ